MRKKSPKTLISRAELARRLALSRAQVTRACADGGRLAAARVGKQINASHPAVAEYLAERGMADGEDAQQASAERVPPLEGLSGLTLGELAARHADVRGLRSWLRAIRDAEEAGRARMLRLRIQGRLIPVATVELMFDAIDRGFELLLSNAPVAIATRIAPSDVAAVRSVVRDLMSQQLKATRDRIDAILAADDPLAPIPVPSGEPIEVTADDPPWGDS